MMRRSIMAIGLVGLVGGGVWIGRSSSEATGAKVATQETRVEVEPARARTAPRPSLPALRKVKDPVPGLAADLVSADPEIRLAAVREVAAGDGDAPSLLVASRDPDPSIAGTAIGALAKMYAAGEVSTADMIARAKDRSGGPRIHTMALNAVGTVPHPDTAKLLAEVATSSSTGERRAATALLGSQSPADAVPSLIRALSDPDDYVRDNAVNGLRALSRGRDFGTDASAWQAWWQAMR